MKKSLIALAVLGAFAGAASAQSSVTLYGRADLNVTNEKAGNDINSTAAGESTTKLNDGGGTTGIGGSRWGLRGAEDLGNGVKAVFQLESGFSADTGVQGQGGRLFGRQAWVGLSSATLGEVRFGRQETYSRLNALYWDPSFNGQTKLNENNAVSISDATADDIAVNVLGLAANAAGRTAARAAVTRNYQLFQNFGDRQDNVISYTSPSFSGFRFGAQVGLSEQVDDNTPDLAGRYQGVTASYANGPFAAGLSYESIKVADVAAGAPNNLNKTFSVGANYNFGVATVYAGYQRVSDVADGSQITSAAANTVAPSSLIVEDQKSYTVGVKVPLGKLTLLANYGNAKYEIRAFGGQELELRKVALGWNYAFSKRTVAYGTFATRSGDADENLAIKREFTLFGLAHSF